MAFGRKSLRGRRYYELRALHFTPIEAREYSKLTRKYPALKRLVAVRTKQWNDFVRECDRKGWESENKRRTEWKKRLVNFYSRMRVKQRRDRETGKVVGIATRWIAKKDVRGRPLKIPKISPWEWYDYVFQRLPDELKWDTPRSHRVRQPDVKVDKIRIRRWIEDLKKSIDRTVDDVKKAQFRQQIVNLEEALRK